MTFVVNPKLSSASVAKMPVDGGRLQIRWGPSQPKQDGHRRESKYIHAIGDSNRFRMNVRLPK
jgi:hypothetical protein